MNADPNPYPGPDKKQDMNPHQVFVLLPCLRTKSLGNEGRRTKWWYRFMSRCSWMLILILTLAEQKARHEYISNLRSFAFFENEEFGRNALWTKGEERRRDMDSFLVVWIRISFYKKQDMKEKTCSSHLWPQHAQVNWCSYFVVTLKGGESNLQQFPTLIVL